MATIDVGQKTVVMVGRTYGTNSPTDWRSWALPFDEVVAEIEKRTKEERPKGATYEVMEVEIGRRTRVKAVVNVEAVS